MNDMLDIKTETYYQLTYWELEEIICTFYGIEPYKFSIQADDELGNDEYMVVYSPDDDDIEEATESITLWFDDPTRGIPYWRKFLYELIDFYFLPRGKYLLTS